MDRKFHATVTDHTYANGRLELHTLDSDSGSDLVSTEGGLRRRETLAEEVREEQGLL